MRLQKILCFEGVLCNCISLSSQFFIKLIKQKTHKNADHIENIIINIKATQQREILYKFNGDNYCGAANKHRYCFSELFPNRRKKNTERYKNSNISSKIDNSVAHEGVRVGVIHLNKFINGSERNKVYLCFELKQIIFISHESDPLSVKQPQHYDAVNNKKNKYGFSVFHINGLSSRRRS